MQSIIKSNSVIQDIQKIIQSIQYDKLFVLTDENTGQKCFPLIESIPEIKTATRIVIAANDTNKNLDNLSVIWKHLTENNATRHSLLLNLGGGMITDMGGFAAATFKRGIKYINIPTTLLGAVDAAVGGKTGINFEGYKNEIGAFYPAENVIISSDFFRTLSIEAILSGYAEMLKHSLIHSQTDWEKLLSFDFENVNFAELNELVFSSVSIKEHIVEKDPFEKNIRKALNFGHTIGHAFESYSIIIEKPVPHGFAIAWGMIAELYLSHRLCGFPKEKLQKTIHFIQKHYGYLNITCDEYEKLYEIMTHDKKNEGQEINFTLLSDIGNVNINQTANMELIFEALDFYRDTVHI
ncbi:MAG: 3-dehydroquinate synthase [Dysgonamonadaceae bacterium]